MRALPPAENDLEGNISLFECILTFWPFAARIGFTANLMAGRLTEANIKMRFVLKELVRPVGRSQRETRHRGRFARLRDRDRGKEIVALS
jgi:hypothetical protein